MSLVFEVPTLTIHILLLNSWWMGMLMKENCLFKKDKKGMGGGFKQCLWRRTEESFGMFFPHMLCPIGFPQVDVGWVPLPGHWRGGLVVGSARVPPCSPLPNCLCSKPGHWMILILKKWSYNSTLGTRWSSERQEYLHCQTQCAMSLLLQWYFFFWVQTFHNFYFISDSVLMGSPMILSCHNTKLALNVSTTKNNICLCLCFILLFRFFC